MGPSLPHRGLRQGRVIQFHNHDLTDLTAGVKEVDLSSANLYLWENNTIQFDVEARVKPKPGHFIRAGYSASANIILDRRSQVLAVEEGNLVFEKEKTFAYVALSTGGFEKREVMTGLSDGINIEIVTGLTGEDRIKVMP